jgi:hypothetical protein
LLPVAALALISGAAWSCGYHVAGKADLLPKSIGTIAVPAFTNNTTRYRLTDRLPEDISREFISRTRYKISPDANAADAVLKGTILNYTAATTIVDQGRASGVEIHVFLQVSLVERATGKVLFNRPNFEVRERYQISSDPSAFFEETDAALNRVSQQAARQVVSAILEDF